jgi:dTDP-4-dehydrorhamnose reductase
MLVTGMSGFLGQHLIEASEIGEWELLSPSRTALDVRDRRRVLDEIMTWKPNVVVHLAHRRDDRETIVDGTRFVADAAAAAGSRLIHMSTDLVFAGQDRPYHERDQPNARLQYGQWKAAAEQMVTRAGGNSLVMRTSLLYGTDLKAPIQRDVAAVVAGRSSMRFFTDEFRCPAHADDVATAIVTLADRVDVTGVLHVAGPEAVSRAALAGAFAARIGADPAQLPTATIRESGVDRPGRVVLDSSAAARLGIRCRPIAEALR